MENDLLLEILAWSRKQPDWQRDALRRLFTTGAVAVGDLHDLLELCKARHGLSKPHEARVLAEEHLAIKDEGELPLALDSVTHHRGVNALARDQTVSFGPRLTIVYGQNAAGKSGYTRILKRACRCRSTEEVLGNVLAEGAPLKAEATIRFHVRNGEAQTVTWRPDTPPTGALAGVNVFDAYSAPVYVRDKTDVAFRPFGLDVFDKLSGICGELRRRLEAERTALQTPPVALPNVPEGTKVALLLGNLTSLTVPEEVRSLATLSEEDQGRLKELRDRQRDFQAGDPTKRAQELDIKANRVDLVAKHIAGLVTLLGDKGLENLRAAKEALVTANKTLGHLRKTVLTPDLLPGTGEEAWRKMWDAAQEFSGTAYPKGFFPVVSDGAKCLLCQQPIGADAATRFKHLQELVASTAQADVRKAEEDVAKHFRAVVTADIAREDVVLALDEFRVDDPVLARAITEFQAEAERIKAAIESVGPLPARGVQKNPEAPLRNAARILRERAAELRKQVPAMDSRDVAELNELEARVTLSGQLGMIFGEIDRKKRVAAYTQCIEDTNTLPITRKSTDLTKRLITERLRDEFEAELKRLEFTDLAVEIRAAGGARGALYHQLVFRNAPGVSLAKVLSEGEARTLSLAAFLTELSTAPARSGIVFDDPVSSLDHVWRARIARRLVLEGKTRQVIVFTHDLVFLKLLVDECRLQDVPYAHQYVRREAESIGICSPDLPWVAMRVKDRIRVLRRRWQEAEKLFRTAGSGAYEREAREIYGLLREAWEQAVSEVLLNDVVEPYRPSIETKKVRFLHDIREQDCRAVDAGMTECSRWIRGHHQAVANGGPFPPPEDLDRRIADLDEWCKRIRKRREEG